MQASPDWSRVRAEFPALQNWTYLNTATFGQLPRCAVDATLRHFARRDQMACSDFLTWFEDADRIRALVAELIHAEASDIAFVPNAASALACLLNGLEWRAGDRIVILEQEFPNSIYHPALLASRGVELIETSWDRFWEALKPGTRLVILSEVNYITGFRAPLPELAPELRRRGILLFVDATQSAGVLRFDAARTQPDVYAAHGYKWLLWPTGAGFMYVHPELRQRLLPHIVGWRSHRDWRRVDELHHGAPVFSSEAEKYEGGMLAFPLLYAMEAALRLVLDLGLDNIERRALELAGRVRMLLRELGGQVLWDEDAHYHSALVAARLPQRPAPALAQSLAQRRILVSARHGFLRISPHFYNNEQDLERLEYELRRLL